MDIAGLSTALAASRIQTQAGLAVLSRSMDTNEALGAGLIEMIDAAAMELSVNPGIGANLDLRV